MRTDGHAGEDEPDHWRQLRSRSPTSATSAVPNTKMRSTRNAMSCMSGTSPMRGAMKRRKPNTRGSSSRLSLHQREGDASIRRIVDNARALVKDLHAAVEPEHSRGDLNFSITKIPVRVHWSFWLVAALLRSDMLREPTRLVLWVIALFFAVLVHELGHAWTARACSGAAMDYHSRHGWTRFVYFDHANFNFAERWGLARRAVHQFRIWPVCSRDYLGRGAESCTWDFRCRSRLLPSAL